MAHGDAREGKWRGNWRMEWVASTLHTTSEHDVSSITTADAHNSAASSRLNWHPCRFKWTQPFRRKTKSGFCACAVTFQTHSTNPHIGRVWKVKKKTRRVLVLRPTKYLLEKNPFRVLLHSFFHWKMGVNKKLYSRQEQGDSAITSSQPQRVTPKIVGRKLRSDINWQGGR